MDLRSLYVVVAGSALAYTWGYGPHPYSLATAAPAPTAAAAVFATGNDAGVRRGNKGVVANALMGSMDVTPSGRDVVFRFHIANTSTRKVELDFPNGKTHDVAVVDASGHEVWRWSAGQLFTQAVRTTPLDAHETMIYTVRWHCPAAHGTLAAVGTLTSNNYPVESRHTFTLP